MRIVMINDCSFVGETLIKHFTGEIGVKHIKRTRGLWSKTFGIMWKILRASGDVYHVHYLLQDCYITKKFKAKAVVGHGHGSDIRYTLHHPIWGRFVRYNLKRCEKILVSTPDLLSVAKEFNEDAEYLPNPVDFTMFSPKPLPDRKEITVFYPCDLSVVKGTQLFIEGVAKFQRDNPHVKFRLIDYGKDAVKMRDLSRKRGIKNIEWIPKVPHVEMPSFYWDADIVVTDFNLGLTLMVSLEAMACGRPVIQLINRSFYPEAPVKDANTPEKVADALLNLVSSRQIRNSLADRGIKYVQQHHDPKKIAGTIAKIYEELTE